MFSVERTSDKIGHEDGTWYHVEKGESEKEYNEFLVLCILG